MLANQPTNLIDAFGISAEKTLFVPLITPPETERSPTPIIRNAIPPEVRQLLFEDERDDLVEFSFKILDCAYIYLKEDYIRASVKKSLMVKYSAYAMGSAVCPSTYVPLGIFNRQDMAVVFYEAASAHFPVVIADPSELNVVSLLMLSLAAFKLARDREAVAFFSLTIKMAKDIGLNCEKSINKLSKIGYEKENMRGLWWCLYHLDRYLVERNCNEISDDMNDVYLPASNLPFEHSQDDYPETGKEIMQSMEWYTPSLPNQSLEAYRLLLSRIAGKALRFNFLAASNKLTTPFLILSTLQDSLRSFRNSLPDYIMSHVALVESDNPIANPSYTWRVVYSVIQMNHVKTLVYHPILLKNIMESPALAAKSSAFRESVLAGLENASFLTAFLRRNPKFHYTTAVIGNYIFHTALPLLLALRMDITSNETARIQDALDIHIKALRGHNEFYETVPILCETLDYLASLVNPVDIVREFTRFKSMRGKSPTSLVKYLPDQPQSSSHGTVSPALSMPSNSPQLWTNMIDTNLMDDHMKNTLWSAQSQLSNMQMLSPNSQSGYQQNLDPALLSMYMSQGQFYQSN